jgi:hypothetical protein
MSKKQSLIKMCVLAYYISSRNTSSSEKKNSNNKNEIQNIRLADIHHPPNTMHAAKTTAAVTIIMIIK